MYYILSRYVKDKAKKGTDDYNRAHKFSMPLQVLVTNTNFFTKKAALDLAIDETMVPFGGCGNFVYNLRGKLVSCGIQLALMLDVGTMCLRGFFACHRAAPKCEGFTWNGPSEVRKLVERFVEGNVGVDKL